MVSISSFNLDDTSYWRSADPENSRDRSTGSRKRSSEEPSCLPRFSSKQLSMAVSAEDSRFIMWVDAVGGFLVCPRREVLIGQAVPNSGVDIPILGDLARRHLKIIRNPEGYLLEPFGYVKLNGQVCVANESDADADSAGMKPSQDSGQHLNLLKHGDLIELTGGIRIRFHKPHPLSASARLDFESPHRTSPWSDAVLLMAESCVFGPNRRNHVICRGWQDDLVFFQQRGQLFCKSLRPISVDGAEVSGKQRLTRNSHIEGEDFSMTIEPLAS